MALLAAFTCTIGVWPEASGQERKPQVDFKIKRQRLYPGGGPDRSPDGKVGVSVVDTEVRLFDRDTKKPLGLPLKHSKQVRTWAFSPDGKRLVTGTGGEEQDPGGFRGDGTVQVWEVSSGVLIGQCTPHAYVNHVAFSPDGKTVLVTSDPVDGP